MALDASVYADTLDPDGIDARAVAPRVMRYAGPGIISRIIAFLLAIVARPVVGLFGRYPRFPWPFAAADRAAALLPRPRNTERRSVRLRNSKAEWLVPASATEARSAILYLHGGGLLLCGLNTHRLLTADIASAAGEPALSVDYRMLPKHSVADAVDDAVDGFRWLLDQGYRADDISIVGDSAGGFIAVTVALEVTERGWGSPRAIALLSPLATVTESLPPRSGGRDALFTPMAVAAMRAHAHRAGGVLPDHLRTGSTLSALPRTLIQVGENELFAADAHALADAIAAGGVPCELQTWAGQFHVFQAAATLSRTARGAVAEVGAFLRAGRV